jgi:hypothetical protein
LSISIKSKGKTTPPWSGKFASPTSMWLCTLAGRWRPWSLPTYQVSPANPERPPHRLRAYRWDTTMVPGEPSLLGAVSLRLCLLIPTHISPLRVLNVPIDRSVRLCCRALFYTVVATTRTADTCRTVWPMKSEVFMPPGMCFSRTVRAH